MPDVIPAKHGIFDRHPEHIEPQQQTHFPLRIDSGSATRTAAGFCKFLSSWGLNARDYRQGISKDSPRTHLSTKNSVSAIFIPAFCDASTS